MNKKVFLLLLLTLSITTLIWNSSNANAITQADEKASLEALYKCYQSGKMVDSIKRVDYSYHDSASYKELSLVSTSGKSASYPLPTGHFKKDTASCQDVIIGAEGTASDVYPGLSGIYGKKPPKGLVTNYTEVENYISDMGYDKIDVYEDKYRMCFNLPYSSEFVGDYTIITLDDAIFTHYACVETHGDTISSLIKDGADFYTTDGPLDDTFDSVYFTIPTGFTNAALTLNVKKSFLGGWECWGLCKESFTLYIDDGGHQSIEGFALDMYAKAVEIGGASYSYMSYYYPGDPQYWQDPVPAEIVERKFDIKSPKTSAGIAAMNYSSNGKYKTYESLAFNNDEIYSLYMGYLKNYYGSSSIYCGASTAVDFAYYDAKVNAGDMFKFTVKTPEAPDGRTCYASVPTKNKNKKVNGVGTTWHFDGTQLSFDEMISKLDGITVSSEIPEEYMTKDSTADGDAGADEPSCYDGGASLGWLLCPLLESLGNAATDIYDKVVEPFLRMDVSLVQSGTDSPTFSSWQQFQVIANILFVIFFIFVIFSQLTGIGISNYGIKKALPKLIVAAVLINLSYIICQLAVDLSNILGASLKSLFDTMSQKVAENVDTPITSVAYGGESYYMTVGDGYSLKGNAISTAVALIIPIITIYTIYSQGMAIIIPLLLGLFSMFMAIMMVFILLSLRKAAVVILVVISPLAFACYMLPNTKKLYDKWFQAMKGMLLLYPIAGALVGGGNFVSTLLLSTQAGNTDFFYALSAMIIGIVPIFFIPSVLKHSFAAIGNIGAKLSGGFNRHVTSRAENAARGRLENSRLTNRRDYMNMRRQQNSAAHKSDYNARKSRRTLERMSGASISSMSAAQRAKYLTAQKMVSSDDRDRQEAYSQRFGSMDAKDIRKELQDMGESGKFDSNMASVALSKLGEMNPSEMLDALDNLSSSKAWQEMSAEDYASIATTLTSQKGNAVAQSMGKVMNANRGKRVSLKDAITGNGIEGKNIQQHISGMSSDALLEQDKDTLSWMSNSKIGGVNLANQFNENQVKTAIAGTDGTSAQSVELQKFINGRSDVADIIDKSMTQEEIASTKAETIRGIASGRGDQSEIYRVTRERARKASRNQDLAARIDMRLANIGTRGGDAGGASNGSGSSDAGGAGGGAGAGAGGSA